MFSEKKTPVSELIVGDPEKPIRELVIALFAILFNLFSIYQLSETVRLWTIWMGVDPWSFAFSFPLMLINTLVGVALFHSVILLIGAGISRLINRRAGAILILIFSIFVLFFSFAGLGFGAFSLLIGAILGMVAGIMGVRQKHEVAERDIIEVI
jgi:hypothetical protein